MNGLNSLGLHVGVELIFLLAEVIGVLKELSCDWSDGLGGCGRTLSMVEVGYFVTMFIVDISVGLPWVWVRSGEPFTTAAKGFAAPDRVSHHPKPEKAHKTSERNLLLYIFFLSQTFFFCLFVWLFFFKGNCLRKWASVPFFCWQHTCVSVWHLPVYVAFRKTCLHAGKRNKDKDHTKGNATLV